jgi:hypothetical protein
MWEITPEKSASVYERVRLTWTMHAQPFLVTYGVSSALSRRYGDYTLMWVAGPWGVFLGINTPSDQHAKPILTT